MALSTRLGKCVNGGVIPILVLGFELLQLSRLHSHCTDEETETQTMERSCLRPQSLGTLPPGPVLSFLCTHFLPCLCGSSPAIPTSPWLQAHAGDGQPPGGAPWGPPKIPPVDSSQGGHAVSLPGQPEGGSIESVHLPTVGSRHRGLAISHMSLWRVARRHLKTSTSVGAPAGNRWHAPLGSGEFNIGSVYTGVGRVQ